MTLSAPPAAGAHTTSLGDSALGPSATQQTWVESATMPRGSPRDVATKAGVPRPPDSRKTARGRSRAPPAQNGPSALVASERGQAGHVTSSSSLPEGRPPATEKRVVF
jgi:hypothetical protein